MRARLALLIALVLFVGGCSPFGRTVVMVERWPVIPQVEPPVIELPMDDAEVSKDVLIDGLHVYMLHIQMLTDIINTYNAAAQKHNEAVLHNLDLD